MVKLTVTKVFQFLLLISPIAIAVDINMDRFDVILFRTGVMLLFFVSLIDSPKRELPDYIRKILVSLFVLCLANMFNHAFAVAVIATTMNLFLGIIAFCIVYIYWDKEQGLVKYIIIPAVINLAFLISQRLSFDPIFSVHPAGDCTLIGTFARFATYIALVTSFLTVPYLVISVIVALVIKQYVALIAVFAVLMVRLEYKWAKIVVFLLSIAFIVEFWPAIHNSLVITRFNLAWKPGLELFFDRPLFGWGLGNITIPLLGTFFNSYLQFIVGVGVFGAVWYGYVFDTLRKKLGINIDTIPLIVLALVMLIEYPVEPPRFWFLNIAILVIALIKGVKNEQSNG